MQTISAVREIVDHCLSAMTLAAVEKILEVQESDEFFQWFRDEAPRELPQFFPPGLPEEEWHKLATALGRSLWNVTPLPRNDYRPEPIPAPKRNEPCPCGSGRKYKHCCDKAVRDFGSAFHAGEIWLLVAEHVDGPRLEGLAAYGRIPGKALGVLAYTRLKEHSPDDALALVESIFRNQPERLDGSYEGALETLLQAYDEIGDEEETEEMLFFLAERLRPPLTAVLWLRWAAEAWDAGEREVGRQYLERARRDAPKNPNVGRIEIIFLLSEGRAEEARQRSKWWLKRLRKWGADGDHEGGAFELFEAASADPRSALPLTIIPAFGELLRRFLDLLEGLADRPLLPYGLEPGPEPREAILETPEAVAEVEAGWLEVWPASEPVSTFDSGSGVGEIWEPANAGSWLTFLRLRPEAFASLSILDDLCDAARSSDVPGKTFFLLEPILDRAEAILDRSLEGSPDDLQLPWMALQNRPALRILLHKLYLLVDRGDEAGSRRLMERLLELNPRDNHGCRLLLVHRYQRDGDDERALELIGRYPDDLSPEIGYGKVLSLYRLGREEEALDALEEARGSLPLVADFLVGRRDEVPEMSPLGVRFGSEDQAWLFREEQLELWRSVPGLLEWLEDATEEP
jgi:tetratricopeptide (TPR) repeat protein